MPDIGMCSRKDCPLWMSCYRFRAVPSTPNQSYVGWGPAERQEDGTYHCDGYWPLTRVIAPVRTIEEIQEANRG